jgi:hypothetical protein
MPSCNFYEIAKHIYPISTSKYNKSESRDKVILRYLLSSMERIRLNPSYSQGR